MTDAKREPLLPSDPEREHAPTHVTIDAFEGDKARVELPDGTTVDWDRASLPHDAHEGAVLRIEGEGQTQHITIDHAETHRRQQTAQAQLDAVNAQSPTSTEIDL